MVVYMIDICGVYMLPWKRWLEVEEGREGKT